MEACCFIPIFGMEADYLRCLVVREQRAKRLIASWFCRLDGMERVNDVELAMLRFLWPLLHHVLALQLSVATTYEAIAAAAVLPAGPGYNGILPQ